MVNSQTSHLDSNTHQKKVSVPKQKQVAPEQQQITQQVEAPVSRQMKNKRLVDIVATSTLSVVLTFRLGTYGIGIWTSDIDVWGKLFVMFLMFGFAAFMDVLLLHGGIYESLGTKTSTRSDFTCMTRYISCCMFCITAMLYPIYLSNYGTVLLNILNVSSIPCLLLALGVYSVYRVIDVCEGNSPNSIFVEEVLVYEEKTE